jgi:UDP-glucose 4-epimerase
MKIAITGVAGLIGSWLSRHALDLGDSVVGFDDLSSGYQSNIDKRVNFIHTNVASAANSTLSRDLFGCDIVYHAAATAYEGLSVFSPTAITNNIVTGTTNLVTAAVNARVGMFVNMSSMARYGHGDGKSLFKETDDCHPADPYGMAKLFAEQQMQMIASLHGIKCITVVPHSVNGPGQKYDDPYRNVVSIMANLMLQGRQPFIYGTGEQKRGFCDVRDVVPMIYQLGLLRSARSDHDNSEVYNVGFDRPEDFVSINELARLVAAEVGFSDLRPIYMPGRPAEVKIANCSSDKIRAYFRGNIERNITLHESVHDIVESIKSTGVKPFSYKHIGVEIENSKKLNCPATWKNKMF